MTATRHLGPARPLVYLLLFGALVVAGCSTSNTNSGLNLVDAQGNHPAGFLSTHPAFAVSDVSQCTSCHGRDLTGGIAKTSCFTSACHHGTIPTWSQAAVHGASAKRAPVASGFASCRICHGNDFSGGGSGVSCFITCHGVNAPHPAAPWRTAGGTNHDNTNAANAPVCAGCHFPGSPNNPAGHPSTPAPAGTPPGCFNNTLCHGVSTTPHILGATWTTPTSAAFHGLEAKRDLGFCQSCHGTPGTILFDGGVAPTRCSACHTSAKAHPTTWYPAPVTTFPGYVASHRNSLNQGTTCSVCHDYTQGRTAPDPAAPSCFSASHANAEHASVGCHPAGPGTANHPVPYLDPDHLGAAQADFDANCSNCHAVSGASPVSSAPACQVCHTGGSPLSPTGSFGVCTSCHGGNAGDPLTTGPDGTEYPNVAGAHAKHRALNSSGTPVFCDTCHFELGFVTQEHYDRANARAGLNALRVPPGDVAFLATYDAETGASSFDNGALTCSNVSCHGGQANLDWRTGTLDVNTQCTSCHASGTAQFNSYNSGDHASVSHEALGCLICHNTTALAANHFTSLSTPAMEGPASATVGGTPFIPAGIGGYDPATGSCTPTCHGTRTW